jgi:hypothetical protein
MSDELLFNTSDIFSTIRAHTESLKKKVQSVPPNTLLNASEQDLVQALVEEFRLNVPVIKDAEIYIAHAAETQVDVSRDPMRRFFSDQHSGPAYVAGNKTVIAVPFEGDAGFFKIQPQSYSLNPPRGDIKKDEILLTYVRTDQNAEAIKQEYQRAVSSIKEYLASLSQSAAQFNGQLEGSVTSQLKARKDRLLADAGMTAAIGLPMKKREGIPLTYSVPVTRRVPKIEQIKVTGSFNPEPALATEDYEEILRIMQNMVQVMELSPHAFHDMGEEDLRSHFLVQLNGAFKGQANTKPYMQRRKTMLLCSVEGNCPISYGEYRSYLGLLGVRTGEAAYRRTEFMPIRPENRGFSQNGGEREKY